MKFPAASAILLAMMILSLPACQKHEDHPHEEHHKIVVTSPLVKNVTVTQQYVCQIHSQRHIKICALEGGYLEAIPVKEGQWVKKGDLLFKILSTLYKARLDAEKADVQLAQLKYNQTSRLFEQKVVSDQDVLLHKAELAKAQAKLELAEAEMNFTYIKAPFDGIIDRLLEQQGSLIQEGDILTTLSDNSIMWVYFNVPEARYLEYMAGLKTKHQLASQVKHHVNDDAKRGSEESQHIELVLADGSTFHQNAINLTVEGKFNNETGNIAFRADFPNPDHLLRHGQTGNVLIHKVQKNAIVIPQRATFEILDKQYVYVIDENGVVHQRPITVQHEMDDIFIIKKGIDVNDKIVLEGVRQVHEGEKVKDYEFRKPEEALANLKNHAE